MYIIKTNLAMVSKALPFTLKLVLFISRLLVKLHKTHRKYLQRSYSNTSHASSSSQLIFKSHLPFSLAQRSDLSGKTIVFDAEGTLLRSSSMFPYFMLVAFEAGSLLRAFLLFVLYPLTCFVSKETSLKIMVMVCFAGIKEDKFRAGTAVLPKFFLEDVGLEGFEFLRRSGGKKVGVSQLPHVMVEGFLKDYLEIDFVVGRELKVWHGYFVGLMEDENDNINRRLNAILNDDKLCSKSAIVEVHSSTIKTSITPHASSTSKEVYVVSEGDKKKWHPLPVEGYPKPLIFHDGRLAFRPNPITMLVMFMWFPFGLTLSIIRVIIAISLPYNASIPILAFSGIRLIKITRPEYDGKSRGQKGLLYVCNHRTLLDPLFLSFGLKKQMAAVTYSLSRMSEMISPIKTVRLTRNRDADGKLMEKMLGQGDLVVCPEGTTCREPYLLRFSPLFAELTDEIVPVALETNVSMFYGTTAGGLKCLDPFLFLMNPSPAYTARFLDSVRGVSPSDDHRGERSRFDVANYVQSELGKALGYRCTSLTRKDKYLILAGNEGIVGDSKR